MVRGHRNCAGRRAIDDVQTRSGALRRIDGVRCYIYSAEFTSCWRKRKEWPPTLRHCGKRDSVRRSGGTLGGCSRSRWAAAFVAFIIYATFRGLWNAEYQFGHGVVGPNGEPVHPESAYFLSPFYSPLLPFVSGFRLGSRVARAGDFCDVDAGRVSADLLLRSQGVLPRTVW